MFSICIVWSIRRCFLRVDPVAPRPGWTFSYFYRRRARIFRIFHQRTEVVYYRPRMYASKRRACFACYRLLFTPIFLPVTIPWDSPFREAETSKEDPSSLYNPFSGVLLRFYEPRTGLPFLLAAPHLHFLTLVPDQRADNCGEPPPISGWNVPPRDCPFKRKEDWLFKHPINIRYLVEKQSSLHF